MASIPEILFHPDAANNPQEAYARIHSECPVTREADMNGKSTVYLTRYADVMWALKHPEVFSSAPGAVDIGQSQPLIPLQVDPPEHAKYRRFLDPEFSPRRMAELEPDVRALTNEVLDRFVDKGGCEFHQEFATPLPSALFLRLMGLPQSDLEMFLGWRDDTIRPASSDPEEMSAIRDRAGKAITAYFEESLAEKTRNPDDGLLTRLANGEIEGRPVTAEEKLGMCHLLLLAGLDTVTATLDCMIVFLARNPEMRAQIVADPSRIPAVIEELLRWDTPVALIARMLTSDTEIGGVEVKAGDGCAVVIGAADVDAEEFERAGSVDFDRPANRHVAFGAGPHRCLGSHFARLELRVAIEEWHRRIPEYSIPDEVEVNFTPAIRQAMSLPLDWPLTKP